MTKRWLIALCIAGPFGDKAFADCVPSPDTPARSSNIFKNSISRCRNSFVSRKMPPLEPLRNPHKNLRKPLSNPHKNLRKPMKMPRPQNARGYLLSTSQFQSRGIPLPMALGLGSRLNGCIQSYTGTTTKITNISTTNISTTTTTTTEESTHAYGRETRADADIANVLTLDEARRRASNIAKLPMFLAATPESSRQGRRP